MSNLLDRTRLTRSSSRRFDRAYIKLTRSSSLILSPPTDDLNPNTQKSDRFRPKSSQFFTQSSIYGPMARTKQARNQAAANFERGSSSRHPQPPHTANMPESGVMVPISANPANAYPFNARMRMTNAMKDREAKLRTFTVLNPIYPDCDLLENLRLLDELKDYFETNGFGFVFSDEPPRVYEALVREFVYSFQPEWRIVPKERSQFNIVEKHVVSWRFRLGGVEYVYSRQQLLDLFGSTEECNVYPFVGKRDLDDFWKMITCAGQDFAPAEHSTQIVLPLWRLVHRFIASCVIMRKDEGRWVTKTDLELMCCMHEDAAFDPLFCLTRSLEESTTPTFRGSYIGGGPLVTLIAMDAGFVLDPTYAMPRKLLGEAEMVRRGFLKLKRDYRGTHRLVVGRDIGPAGRDERPQQPAPSSSLPTQDIPPSSAPRPITLESLSAQVDSLATSFQHFSAYTHDHFRWEGDTFRDLYTRMGYDGYVPPPQYSAMPFRADDVAGPSGTAGDMEREDDEPDDEATASESGEDDTDGSEAD